MARTMLDEYKTPQRFWIDAIDTACLIINRVYLHKFFKKTAYELLTDKKPEVMTAFEIPDDIYKDYCTPDEAKFGKENKN